jgi:hypothetical protein
LGRCGRKERKKRKRPAGQDWVRAELEERERERERERVLSFFLNFFQIHFFKHSNSNQTKSMHSNQDAQTLIISKLF